MRRNGCAHKILRLGDRREWRGTKCFDPCFLLEKWLIEARALTCTSRAKLELHVGIRLATWTPWQCSLWNSA